MHMYLRDVEELREALARDVRRERAVCELEALILQRDDLPRRGLVEEARGVHDLRVIIHMHMHVHMGACKSRRVGCMTCGSNIICTWEDAYAGHPPHTV